MIKNEYPKFTSKRGLLILEYSVEKKKEAKEFDSKEEEEV